jgi:hypothetical protein
MPVLVHIILPTFGKNPAKNVARGKAAAKKSGGPVIDQSAKTGLWDKDMSRVPAYRPAAAERQLDKL